MAPYNPYTHFSLLLSTRKFIWTIFIDSIQLAFPTYTFIDYCKIFLPTRLFQPTCLFDFTKFSLLHFYSNLHFYSELKSSFKLQTQRYNGFKNLLWWIYGSNQTHWTHDYEKHWNLYFSSTRCQLHNIQLFFDIVILFFLPFKTKVLNYYPLK